MNKRTLLTASVFLLSSLLVITATPARAATPADSIGIEKVDGKRYILHRVDEGQTLYAVARRYGRSVAEIKTANPDMADALRYAQVIRVPIPDGALSRKEARTIDRAIREEEKMKKREASAQPPSTPKPGTPAEKTTARPAASGNAKSNEDPARNDPAKTGIHVVAAGQTLYSLASRYGVSPENLRRWNDLPNNNILIGQALIVSERASQDRAPDVSTTTDRGTPDRTKPTAEPPRKTEPTRPEPATPNAGTPDRTKPTTDTPRKTEPANAGTPDRTTPDRTEPEIPTPSPGNDAPMPTRGRRQSSSGVAEIIENDKSGKYLALHRTAPIGTLVQVRNLFNNQSMWVKVVGRLPDTGVNDKILIKLSAQTFAKLSPQDQRFRAEVSYMTR